MQVVELEGVLTALATHSGDGGEQRRLVRGAAARRHAGPRHGRPHAHQGRRQPLGDRPPDDQGRVRADVR